MYIVIQTTLLLLCSMIRISKAPAINVVCTCGHEQCSLDHMVQLQTCFHLSNKQWGFQSEVNIYCIPIQCA